MVPVTPATGEAPLDPQPDGYACPHGRLDELAGFLFTGREEADGMQGSAAKAATLSSNSISCKRHEQPSSYRPGNLRSSSWAALPAVVEPTYAARTTVPIVSFLPNLRRIVRGLMCSN